MINKNSLDLKGDEAIGGSFSAYFASIGSDIKRGLAPTSVHSYQEYFSQSEDTSMFLAPVSFEEFQKKKNDKFKAR